MAHPTRRPLSIFTFALVGFVAAELLAVATLKGAEPQWIWGTKDVQAGATASTCHFRKVFEMGVPESGTIEITCDNRYVLRLNGRLVGANNNWQQLDRYDVAPLLVEGENTIDIRCINDGDAAGLAARVTVKSKSGEEQVFVTDAGWEARSNVGKSWDPAALAEIEKSETFVLGELGKAAPWGAGFKIGPLVKLEKLPADRADQPFELKDGDRVVLLGNTFIERAQSYGYLELALTIRRPDRHVTFRNLGWSGDTVTGIARARFGNVNEGFRHLTEHVYALKPTVIFVAYGANESFAGEAGLDQFRDDLDKLLETLEATGARIILLSPLRHENLGPPLPDPTKHNLDVAHYLAEIRDVANSRGLRFVDLDEGMFGTGPLPSSVPMDGSPRVHVENVPPPVDLTKETPISEHPLTNDGVHLSLAGYRRCGQVLASLLGGQGELQSMSIDVSSGKSQAKGMELSDVKTTADQVDFTATQHSLPYPAEPAAGEKPYRGTLPVNSIGIKVEGLKLGKYRLTMNGEPVLTADAAQFAAGMHVMAKGLAVQPEQLRQLILKKNELYFHRWRPQNETYLYLFRKHEQGNNAREIPEFDPLVEELEKQIATLCQPAPHKFELRPLK